MQISSPPPPIAPTALPQDAVAKAAPHMQATPPLTRRPVDPSVKSEKFRQFKERDGDRGRSDRRDGSGYDGPEGDMRGSEGGVDLSV